ncbi:hypothetical protein MTR_5g069140 [Medicago truncatula]|uniref:Uncharacterized protein n=1 Tax=Medicago truncatula TaxID=3880 RepID=G7KDZ4_MEDTR|nr:hypothetical protein MTR_5g069140 [Medicago truncatula]
MADKDFEFYEEVIPRILFSIGIRNEKVGSILGMVIGDPLQHSIMHGSMICSLPQLFGR